MCFFIKLNYSISFFKVWPGLIPQIEVGHLSPDLSVVTWRTCVDFFVGFSPILSPFFSDFSVSKNTFSPLRVWYLPPPSTPVPGEHLGSQVHVLPDHHLTGVFFFWRGNSWKCFRNPRGKCLFEDEGRIRIAPHFVALKQFGWLMGVWFLFSNCHTSPPFKKWWFLLDDHKPLILIVVRKPTYKKLRLDFQGFPTVHHLASKPWRMKNGRWDCRFRLFFLSPQLAHRFHCMCWAIDLMPDG